MEFVIKHLSKNIYLNSCVISIPVNIYLFKVSTLGKGVKYVQDKIT